MFFFEEIRVGDRRELGSFAFTKHVDSERYRGRQLFCSARGRQLHKVGGQSANRG